MSEISSKKIGVDLTIKDQEWMDASLSLKKYKKRPYIKNLISNVSLVGSNKGYTVIADKKISAGEIVEECLTLVTTTGTKETADPVLAIHTIQHPEKSNPIFDESGEPIIIGLGNFNVYRKSDNPNVAYSFDSNFNVVRIIAIDDIKIGDELTLVRPVHDQLDIKKKNDSKNNTTTDTKKSGGCGCGKNKKKQENSSTKKIDQEKLKDLSEDMRNYPPDHPKAVFAESEFKSMIGNKDFKSIEIND